MASKTRWESTGDLMFWSVVASCSVGAATEVISWWYHSWSGVSIASFGVAVVIFILTVITYVIHVIQKGLTKKYN
jgi:hypothetical protein